MTAFPPENRPEDEDPIAQDDPRRPTADPGPTPVRDSTRRTGQATIVLLLAVLLIVVLIVVL